MEKEHSRAFIVLAVTVWYICSFYYLVEEEYLLAISWFIVGCGHLIDYIHKHKD